MLRRAAVTGKRRFACDGLGQSWGDSLHISGSRLIGKAEAVSLSCVTLPAIVVSW
jgi:hypothetical protein